MGNTAKVFFRTAAAAVAIALLASGCVSEAELRSRRIYSDVQSFATLDQAAQARVQEGYIQPGDPSFAAWMAYGDPASKSIQTTTNGTFEVWNYFRPVPEYYEEWIYDDMPPPRHHHRPPPDPRFGPPPPPPPHYGWRREERVRYVDALKRQLLFSDGLCVGVFEY